ncbi:hypothetical protein GF386_01810 [Candidatus Pacearchaeota archaeon]|nr:hypothetical protein [Candidatus Pacearchaeota archaeon]MBD3282915.1 hypothetical protein [Candidatus Pacearchaeota archaeon]
MEKIGELKYGPFTTTVNVTKDVKVFFENGEVNDLIEGINSKEWYQSWLLKYLDKNTDGLPDEEFGKDFELIYTGIIENPEDYQEVDEIIENFGIDKERFIFDGSKTIFQKDPSKTKFWVRWIVVRKQN